MTMAVEKRNPKKMKPTEIDDEENYIPDDVIFSTLLPILSVKSLLRFTGVCKSWNNLIRSSSFIAEHRRAQIHNNKNKDTHLLYMPVGSSQVCTLLRQNGAALPSVPKKTYAKEFEALLPFGDYEYVGFCEGLICLEKESDVFIWNPFVGSLKTLPRSPPPRPDRELWQVFYMFGFAEQSRDYRVIKKIHCAGFPGELQIYSLAADSWRIIEFPDIGSSLDSPLSRVFFKGFIYWFVSSSVNIRFKLMRFNVEEEIFEETDSPFFTNNRLISIPMVLNDSLFIKEVDSIDKKLYVWIKKRSETSWVRRICALPRRSRRIEGISENGHFAYEEEDRSIDDRRSVNHHLFPMRETLLLLDQK